VLESHMCHCVE